MISDFINKYQSEKFNNLFDYFENNNKYNYPFIITLEKDQHKYKTTNQILKSLGLNPIKFEGIYGNSLSGSDPYILNSFYNLNNGEIGCFLSHIYIWYIASQHPRQDQYTMIFEDDLWIEPGVLTPEILAEKLDRVSEYNSNLIYLGKCVEICEKLKKLEGDIYQGIRPFCFHAYMIKNSYAKYLYDHIITKKTINKPVDKIVFDYTKTGDIVVFHPSLFYQNINYESSLRPKYRQFFNLLECVKLIKKKIETFTTGESNNNNYFYLILILFIILIFFLIKNNNFFPR